MNKVERYVNALIKKMDAPRKEKQEYKFQFIDHINSLKEEYMTEGLSESVAISQAIKEFGSDRQILATDEPSLRINQIISIVIFTVAITLIALYLQWAEFFKGYSLSGFNLSVSVIFLLTWSIFSFYWSINRVKKYYKFITIYWTINIVSAAVIWIFSHNRLVQSFMFPFYIWYGGPLYGFRHMLNSLNLLDIDIPSLIFITSPLGILFCNIGYRCGYMLSKFKKIQ